jgi:hypothetical protein
MLRVLRNRESFFSKSFFLPHDLNVERHSGAVDPSDVDTCVEVRNTCLWDYPRLMSLIPNVEPGLTVVTYSNRIEAEVDGIYKQANVQQKHYDWWSHCIVAMVQRIQQPSQSRSFFKQDPLPLGRIQFFQSYYPPRELAMTGYLFGSLVRHSLIDYLPLGIAMRYIMDAFDCPSDTNLFKFGMQALSWRRLSEALIRRPHLVEAREGCSRSCHSGHSYFSSKTVDKGYWGLAFAPGGLRNQKKRGGFELINIKILTTLFIEFYQLSSTQ